MKSLHIYLGLFLSFSLCLSTCQKPDLDEGPYRVGGMIMDAHGHGIPGIAIYYDNDSVITDPSGFWTLEVGEGARTFTPEHPLYDFTPPYQEVERAVSQLNFTAIPIFSLRETQVINWLSKQQLSNGLVPSTENGTLISTYDQALSALVFILARDFARAEMIFDFFDARIDTELRAGPGGFSQFRDLAGIPNNHRWMGDNAWLLIALNQYHAFTHSSRYQVLADAIAAWLQGLQDSDGGLWAGYGSDDTRLEYKVTEGQIDAFNAIPGYSTFHADLLTFLRTQRWDASDRNLMAWPENPPYRYALDNHSWSYCAFPDYPVSALSTASRFLTTQVGTVSGNSIQGYDIDEDRDAVFMEGTGQMAVAYRVADDPINSNYYLGEMEQLWMASSLHTQAGGFPYASNRGTGYGNTPHWLGVDTDIAIAPGAWYIFARRSFNPFDLERNKAIPLADRFWF